MIPETGNGIKPKKKRKKRRAPKRRKCRRKEPITKKIAHRNKSGKNKYSFKYSFKKFPKTFRIFDSTAIFFHFILGFFSLTLYQCWSQIRKWLHRSRGRNRSREKERKQRPKKGIARPRRSRDDRDRFLYKYRKKKATAAGERRVFGVADRESERGRFFGLGVFFAPISPAQVHSNLVHCQAEIFPKKVRRWNW